MDNNTTRNQGNTHNINEGPASNDSVVKNSKNQRVCVFRLLKTTKLLVFIERLRSFLMSKRGVSFYIVVVIALLLVLSYGFVPNILNLTNPPGSSGQFTDLGEVNIKAEKSDALGVALDSNFIVTTTKDVSAQELRSAIRLNRDLNFVVQKEAPKRYKVVLEGERQPNTVYNLEVISKNQHEEDPLRTSWAFQTRDKFRVVSTLPSNKATNVPTNTGIEITFSASNFNDDIFKNLTITPNVAGNFERNGKILIFKPKKGFEHSTIYTVTLNNNFTLNGTDEKLESPYTFSFATRVSDIPEANISFTNIINHARTTSKPVIELMRDYTTRPEDNKANINVYKFKNIDSFVNAAKKRLSYWFYMIPDKILDDKSDLSKILSTSTQIRQINGSGRISIVEIPDKLNAGFYLVEIENSGKAYQTLLQSHDIGAYANVSETKTLVWLHNLSNGKAISEANIVNLDTNQSFKTNSTGVALFDSSEKLKDKENYSLLKIQGNNQEMIAVIDKSIPTFSSVYPVRTGFPYVKSNDDFWTYLYTDRSTYLPSDEINFWGFAKSRLDGSFPKKLTAKLTFSSPITYKEVLVQTKEVNVADSFYISNFLIQNATPGAYKVEIYENENLVTLSDIFVQSYSKPAFIITAKPEKKGVFVGEDIIISGSVKYPEGTPIPNMDLKISGAHNTTVRSDSNGNFSFKYKAQPIDGYGVQFTSRVDITLNTPEVSTSKISVNTMVFGSSIFLSPASFRESQKVSVKAQRIDGKKVDLTNLDYSGTVVQNHKLDVVAKEVKYNKVEDGEYYDHVDKVIKKIYRYNIFEEEVAKSTITTNSEGIGTYTVPDKTKNYIIEFISKDEAGRKTSISLYHIGDIEVALEHFYIESSLQVNSSKERYKLGDKDYAKLTIGNNPAPTDLNISYLFIKSQNGITDFLVTKDNKYEFTFEEKDAPNFTISAVSFNGKFYQVSQKNSTVFFDYNLNSLKINVKTDKAEYRPGEDVKLTVSVNDLNNQPRKAQVNISVVDEAYFSLYPQKAYPLEDLYQPVSSGHITSYVHPRSVYDAEGRFGGMGSSVSDTSASLLRDDFKDNSIFKTINMDSSEETISFKLPENLTTWRVTVQAIDGSKKLPLAGIQTYNFVSKLPFFTDININTEYLVNDKPIVQLRAYGQGIPQNNDVKYTINAETLGLNNITVNGKSNTDLDFSLPQLKPGIHKIQLTAESGNFKDSISKTITVYETRSVRSFSQTHRVKNDLKVDINADKATLTFVNSTKAKYFAPLIMLRSTHGDRIDQKLSRIYANELLSEYFGEVDVNEESFDYKDFTGSKGGLGIYPYADEDPELSALIADVIPEKVSFGTLRDYFYSVVNNSTESQERKIIAYYGLAALKEPVLNDLNFLVTKLTLSPKEKTFVALAYAAIGDTNAAMRLFTEIVANSTNYDRYITVQIGENNDDKRLYNSYIAYLGVKVNEFKTAEKIFAYVNDNPPEKILINVAVLGFIKESLIKRKNQPSTSKFAYVLNGEKTEKTLDKFDSYSLEVTKDQLKAMTFESISGETSLTVIENKDISSIKPDGKVSIQRSYSVNGRKTTSFKPGDLIRVSLKFDISKSDFGGCYQVIDNLPGGLKPVFDVYVTGKYDAWYPYQVDKNRLSFCINRNYMNKNKLNNEIVYYALVANKGEFTADHAVIQSLDNDSIINISTKQNIVIN